MSFSGMGECSRLSGNEIEKGDDLITSPWRQSVDRAPGYPLTGCSPAEPVSVSPGSV